MTTKQDIATQLLKYMNHKISIAELVDWAESKIMEGDLEPGNEKALMQILGKIAAADVKDFGLFWSDCESIMSDLGYVLKVDASIAA